MLSEWRTDEALPGKLPALHTHLAVAAGLFTQHGLGVLGFWTEELGPGGVVLRQCIEPLGLTITNAAAALGVTRTTLSELVHGKCGISPEMAVRLSQVFGGSAESWLTQQAHYNLAQVRRDKIKLQRLAMA
jgi:antitoxin HigA-1